MSRQRWSPLVVVTCLAIPLACGAPAGETRDASALDDADGAVAVSALPEGHPWPGRARPLTQVLDGEWEYAPDPGDVGLAQGWWDPARADFTTAHIRVPLPPEAKGAFVEVTEGPPPGTVHWYRRQIQIPEAWSGLGLSLVFLGVDGHASAWWDGVPIGEGTPGAAPLIVDLPLEPQPGPHTLVVRSAHRGLDDPDALVGLEETYGATSGIRRSVFLEAHGARWTGTVEVAPDWAAGALDLRAALRGDEAAAGAYEVVVTRPEGGLDRVAGALPGSPLEVRVPLTNPRPWSPSDPWVYEGALRLLADGAVVDEQRFTFGLRAVGSGWCPGGSPEEIAARAPDREPAEEPAEEPTEEEPPLAPYGCVTINGQPHYLRAVTWVPRDAWSLGACPAGSCAEEIGRILDAGFNAIRVRGDVLPPLALDAADRLGLLVIGDVPGFALHAPDPLAGGGSLAYEQQLDDLVAQGRAHPALIAWALFQGEAGLLHPPFWRDAAARDRVGALVRRARANAPELLFEDNVAGGSGTLDGSQPHVVTDLQSYLAPPGAGAGLLEWLADVQAHATPGSAWNFFGATLQSGQPILAAETSCGGAGLAPAHLSGCLPDLVSALRGAPRLGGFTLATWRDPLGGPAGLVDETGAPRVVGLDAFGVDWQGLVGEDMAWIEPPLLRQLAADANLGVRVGVATALGGARPGWRLEGDAFLDTCTDNGRSRREALGVYQVELPPDLPAGARVLDEWRITPPQQAGVVTLRLRLLDAQGETRSSSRLHAVLAGECRAPDPEDPAPDWIMPLGHPSQGQWSGGWGADSGGEQAAGIGHGSFAWHVRKPSGFDASHVARYALVMEAAANPAQWPPAPTDGDPLRSRAWCRLRSDGEALRFTLEDAPADARGVLSGVQRPQLGWAYGALLRLDWQAAEAGTPDYNTWIQLECGVDASELGANGLRVFDHYGGRWPLRPSLLAWRAAR